MKKKYGRKDLSMSKIKDIVHLRLKGCSQREIGRRLSIGRTTVQYTLHRIERSSLTLEEVLTLSECELKSRISRRGRYQTREREHLDFESIAKEMSRPHVTLELLHAEYLERNPGGYCYSVYCAKYRAWKKTSRIWMRQEHKAGEKVMVDYSGAKAHLVDSSTGELIEVPLFVGVLPLSFYIYVEAAPSMSLFHWIEAHQRMFHFFGGVPKAVVPDNLKTGVTKACRYAPLINKTYRELSDHYHFDVLPTRVRKPQDKGSVEKAVQMAQRWILAAIRNELFFSIAELNQRLRELTVRLNDKKLRRFGKSRREAFFELEQEELQSLPVNRFFFREWKQVKVAPDYHVEFESNRYSVPYTLTGKKLEIRVTVDSLEVFDEGSRVALHTRINGRKKSYSTTVEHMPEQHKEVSKWDIPTLLMWAERIGPSTKIQAKKMIEARKFPAHAIRPLLGLLTMSKHIGTDRLERACAFANEYCLVGFREIRTIIEHEIDAKKQQQQYLEEETATISCHGNIRGDFH